MKRVWRDHVISRYSLPASLCWHHFVCVRLAGIEKNRLRSLNHRLTIRETREERSNDFKVHQTVTWTGHSCLCVCVFWETERSRRSVMNKYANLLHHESLARRRRGEKDKRQPCSKMRAAIVTFHLYIKCLIDMKSVCHVVRCTQVRPGEAIGCSESHRYRGRGRGRERQENYHYR